MKRISSIASAVLALLATPSVADAQTFQSYTPIITAGTLIDFEGLADNTPVTNQYAGVVFGSTTIADVFPTSFGYGFSSGNTALTTFASSDPISGLFATPVSALQFFLSDTAPLGDYTLTILGSGGSLLDQLIIASGSILPPGYGGGFFPAPGTTPLPGLYVGALRSQADIFGFVIDSSSPGDSFAIDDLRYVSAAVPEPAAWAMMIGGFALAGGALRRRGVARAAIA